MHILSPVTDNCPTWTSSRERMAVEIISWPISMTECCRTGGSNPRPPEYQSDAHPIELPGPAIYDECSCRQQKSTLFYWLDILFVEWIPDYYRMTSQDWCPPLVNWLQSLTEGVLVRGSESYLLFLGQGMHVERGLKSTGQQFLSKMTTNQCQRRKILASDIEALSITQHPPA